MDINFLNTDEVDFVKYINKNIKGDDNMNNQEKITENLRSELKSRGIDMITVEENIKLDVIERIENILKSDTTIDNIGAESITLYVEYLEEDIKDKLEEMLKGLKKEYDTCIDNMEYKKYEILGMSIDYFYSSIDKSLEIIIYNI